MAIVKARNWSIIVYPESLPDDWLYILSSSGLPCFISPLHHKDLESEGSDAEKKPHYHVGVCYPGPTTFAVVSRLAASLGSSIVSKVDNVKGMYEYHVHKNNPEKYQYPEHERILLNGFDIVDYKELRGSEVNRIVFELTNMIYDNEIMEYSDFMLTVSTHFDTDYFFVARTNTIYFNTVITSFRHKHLQ